jgi:hypothetical protein
MPQQKISAVHPTMNQFVDLSMESVIHHRFQTFTQLRVILLAQEIRVRMTMPHLQAMPVICASLPSGAACQRL